MTPRLRRLALTAHIALSVGWLGAVVAYLALAIAALSGEDAQTVRSAYLAMERVGWFVIVPLAVAALLTGQVMSLGTAWGLFQHYWVASKFLLTVIGTVILLLHMPAVSHVSGVAAEAARSGGELVSLRHPTFVVHAGGGLLVLLATTALSVYKPWGLTAYGRGKRDWNALEKRAGGDEPTAGAPRAVYLLLAIVALVAVLVILHLLAGGHGRP